MSKFKKIPEFEEIEERLNFFNASYKGGAAYKAGRYLKEHAREKGGNYTKRLAAAAFRNFCAPIIDIYTSYLYRDQPTRELESLEDETQDFLKDCDFQGRPYEKMVRELSRKAGIFGMYGLIVDKPQSEAETKAAENELGIRPYLVKYSPLQFISYTFEKVNGRFILTELVLQEDTGNPKKQGYIVWTPDSWETFERDQTEKDRLGEPKSTGTGKHGLKEIPFILIKNRDTLSRMQALSDIDDISDINRRVYNLDANADEIIENTAFPFLELPESNNAEGETVIGTGNLLIRPEGTEKGALWIEPPHSSLPNILEWRREAIEDIREMAKTGKMSTSGVQVESGAALEIRFQQLNALLSDKAENMEKVEDNIFRLYALWQEATWDGTISYPRKFGIRDLSHDLDQAVKALIVIPSATFEAEQAIGLAGRILKDVDKGTMDKIEAEVRVNSTIDVEDDLEGAGGEGGEGGED